MSLSDSPQLKFHCSLFFFNDTATTEIYTLSLHDALPISHRNVNTSSDRSSDWALARSEPAAPADCSTDRKSTRLNSSHQIISYAVFCLKKKKIALEPQLPHALINCALADRAP